MESWFSHKWGFGHQERYFEVYCGTFTYYEDIVWKNFYILNPKLVLAYAEGILCYSRLKNCGECKFGWLDASL